MGLTSVSAKGRLFDSALRRVLDLVLTVATVIVLAPVIVILAIVIKVESPGPVVFRSPRVGRGGARFGMLKFRKMVDGAGGQVLTAPDDERFTRLGGFLARTKLDELPQLWNVLKGDMSLVGPRPEVPPFVAAYRAAYEPLLQVRPGITGLAQLAFAKEAQILDREDRLGHYVRGILPQKLQIDELYVARESTRLYLSILGWTAAAVLFGLEVAVNRKTGQLSRRKRPSTVPASVEPMPASVEQTGS